MTRRTPELLAAVCDAWRAGTTAPDIARRHRLARSTVHRWLSRSGQDFTDRKSGRVYPAALTPELIEVCRSLRADGLTWDAVAARMGFDKRYLQEKVKLL